MIKNLKINNDKFKNKILIIYDLINFKLLIFLISDYYPLKYISHFRVARPEGKGGDVTEKMGGWGRAAWVIIRNSTREAAVRQWLALKEKGSDHRSKFTFENQTIFIVR